MKSKFFVFVLVLQTLWLLGTVAVQEHTRTHGRIILLETRQADPRHLLRGDYLMLHYKISDIPTNLFSPPLSKDLPFGTTIFVALAPGTNRFYEITRASTINFTPPANEILLRGRSDERWWSTNTVHVAYGIENYYVAENTGNPTGKLTVQAVVPASGHPIIKEVFVNGKPYAEVMKQ